jgi:hypothetical protein
MNKKPVAFSVASLLFANIAIAVPVGLNNVALPNAAMPLEEGGMLAIAAACLALGIRIIQRKRNR